MFDSLEQMEPYQSQLCEYCVIRSSDLSHDHNVPDLYVRARLNLGFDSLEHGALSVTIM